LKLVGLPLRTSKLSGDIKIPNRSSITLDLDIFVNFSKVFNTIPHCKHISEISWCKIIHKLKIQESSCFECGGLINKACTGVHERQLKSRRLMSELKKCDLMTCG
jgi:hypothetical protein